MASELEMREAEDAIDRLRDQLAAKDAEIAALKEALVAARQQLATLGGSIVEIDGKIVSDAIQAAVLSIVDRALTQDGRAGE